MLKMASATCGEIMKSFTVYFFFAENDTCFCNGLDEILFGKLPRGVEVKKLEDLEEDVLNAHLRGAFEHKLADEVFFELLLERIHIRN
jgi:hypothetical protein